MGRNQSKVFLPLEWDGKCDCEFECECEGECECECDCECKFKCEGEGECECKGKCECECECDSKSESESNSKSDRAERRPREVQLIAARTPREARPRGLGLIPGSAPIDHKLGHKLAVNRTYICNSFNLGHIQIINAQTSLRSLFRGHTQELISSALSITRTLSGEVADGQRKLLAIVAAGANSNAFNPLATQLSNGPLEGLMAELTLDRTIKLSRLISDCKYEEVFTAALQRNDVSIVSWLCSLVDLRRLLASKPLPLSQQVMLSLFQQLARDTSVEATTKLDWMTEISVNINPAEPSIALHVQPILEQVYQILGHQRNQPTVSALEASSISILMHVIHSVLMSCE